MVMFNLSATTDEPGCGILILEGPGPVRGALKKSVPCWRFIPPVIYPYESINSVLTSFNARNSYIAVLTDIGNSATIHRTALGTVE